MFGYITCVSSVYGKEVMVKIRKWRPFWTPTWTPNSGILDFGYLQDPKRCNNVLSRYFIP